jgi:hypothetical protein
VNYCGFGQYLYITTRIVDKGQHGDGKSYPLTSSTYSKIEK